MTEIVKNRRAYTGPFEHLVLTALAAFPEGAYEKMIREHIEARSVRTVSSGALSTTLHRMREKGYVWAVWKLPAKTRGGRSRHYYGLTEGGQAAIRRFEAENPPVSDLVTV